MWTTLLLLTAPITWANEADETDAGDVPALAGDEKEEVIEEEELVAPSLETIQEYLEGQGMPPAEAAAVAMMRVKQMALVDVMEQQQGSIELAEGLATLTVPEGFSYLSPEHTSLLLEAWGNPADPELLGALLPAGLDNLFSAAAWIVILDYEPIGYVSDDGAASLDADALLGVMQAGGAARRAPPLAGWAEPPRYDPAAHALTWGRELVFEASDHTVNYDVRVLGRAGVLTMRAVLSASRFQELRPQLLTLSSAAVFSDGYRYGQFVPDRDPRASVGLDAIVAGQFADLLQASPEASASSEGGRPWALIAGVALLLLVGAGVLLRKGKT